MSAQNQIGIGEGVILRSPEYRYLLNAANIVTLLGAQTAELGVTGRGVELFAMKTFDIPKWRFLTVVGRPRPAPGRAIVAHPGKITGALHVTGAPERHSGIHIHFGDGTARFVGPGGTAEISGRVIVVGSGKSLIPRGVEPLAEMFVDRYYLVSGVLLALGRGYYGAYAELKLTKEPDDRWKLHVLTDAGDDYSFFVAKMYRPPEVQFRGLYKAWTLSELLMLLGNYVKLEFLGSVDEPALYASWDDMLGGEDEVVPVHMEFYLEGST
jgi:hypothetical protein